jgi:8-oxo-dGTP pyrophosphatase MutT (NUDIX family)
MPISSGEVLNVFQPGLIRGSARLAHAPHKRYFYVEHPTEGWRVFLRSCAFLHEAGARFDKGRFIVVKRTDGDASKKTWEPPKGQMEGKDAGRSTASIKKLLEENVRREVEEESKISKILSLQHTGLILQNKEPDYPENTFFQYHIFQGFVSPAQLQKAVDEFAWIKEHPEAFARFRSDKREKDDISWYNSEKTKLMGKWSPTIVPMYLAN